ncbi:regulatory protein RecX [Sphingomonas xanthus]|uniref:Regulatory protein RecX n=1 Tax=Sphingomonas xanthus TaxID=2594473 RepID=A0A516IPY8_9SPHN|nr:RecX family transcriptional regulator [Sphingomonas xanthus]QDP18980.1 RecX family transcriptional regulator [Sphingomonas xanthus]
MAARIARKPRPPLDESKLADLALHYVGRFATSRAKLIVYLRRKLRERGWSGTGEPDLDVLADRMVRSGYVDDRAFALSKARSLGARGYGPRRLVQALAAAGIGEEDGADAREQAALDAVEAALRFARRRAIGPFAETAAVGPVREKALAAMIRAGHRFALARAIVDHAPGNAVDIEILQESAKS